MATKARDGFYKRGRFWWVRTDPVSGKPKSTKCRTIEAAHKWRAAQERKAADPSHAAAETAELGEWIERTIAMKRAAKKSAATLLVWEQKLGHFARIWGEGSPLSAITPVVIDAYVAQRRDEGAGDMTISRELAHLAQLLREAQRAECYAGDISKLRPGTLVPTYIPRTRALSLVELGALLPKTTDKLGAFVRVSVALGLRRSEAFRLRPEDIDLDVGIARIRGTKTKGAKRTVPILSTFIELLTDALPHLPAEYPNNLGRDLKAACARAGIAACTPNDLRRSHATLQLEAGVDRDVIRRMLGHSSTAMLDRVYGQPSVEALREQAEPAMQKRYNRGKRERVTPEPASGFEPETYGLRNRYQPVLTAAAGNKPSALALVGAAGKRQKPTADDTEPLHPVEALALAYAAEIVLRRAA